MLCVSVGTISETRERESKLQRSGYRRVKSEEEVGEMEYCRERHYAGRACVCKLLWNEPRNAVEAPSVNGAPNS
jgi:hypothetical protein